jgi:hypothetical protein
LQDPPKFTQIGIFGLKTNRLATLMCPSGDVDIEAMKMIGPGISQTNCQILAAAVSATNDAIKVIATLAKEYFKFRRKIGRPARQRQMHSVFFSSRRRSLEKGYVSAFEVVLKVSFLQHWGRDFFKLEGRVARYIFIYLYIF